VPAVRRAIDQHRESAGVGGTVEIGSEQDAIAHGHDDTGVDLDRRLSGEGRGGGRKGGYQSPEEPGRHRPGGGEPGHLEPGSHESRVGHCGRHTQDGVRLTRHFERSEK
jgi:hypothetical protein